MKVKQLEKTTDGVISFQDFLKNNCDNDYDEFVCDDCRDFTYIQKQFKIKTNHNFRLFLYKSNMIFDLGKMIQNYLPKSKTF